jgi:Flp pilus assembly pilin Flp
MRRCLREDGQTAAEYVGLLALVAAILVALGSADVHGKVAGGVADALCVIGGCERGSGDRAAPASRGDGRTLPDGATTTLPQDPDDFDGDGISNAVERSRGLDPRMFDSDGDGYGDAEERLHGTDPRVDDTDGDGLSDGDELQQRGGPGTSPFDSDADDDGLSDGEEVAIGTDPTRTESDPEAGSTGDGLSDAEELRLGTDPTSHDTDGDGAWDGQEVEDGTDPLVDERSGVEQAAAAVGNAVLDDPTLLLPGGALVKGGVKGAAGFGRALVQGGGRKLIAGAKSPQEAAALRRRIVERIRQDTRPAARPGRRNPTTRERNSPSRPADAPPARPDPDRPLAIGRTDDLQRLRPGEQSLLDKLPYYGSDKRAGLAQNLGQLRDYVRSAGYPPIRDASPRFELDRAFVPSTGTPNRPGEWLQAERDQLRALGYERAPGEEYWVHRGSP